MRFGRDRHGHECGCPHGSAQLALYEGLGCWGCSQCQKAPSHLRALPLLPQRHPAGPGHGEAQGILPSIDVMKGKDLFFNHGPVISEKSGVQEVGRGLAAPGVWEGTMGPVCS